MEATHAEILSSAENEVTTQMPQFVSPLSIGFNSLKDFISDMWHSTCCFKLQGSGVLPIDINLNKESKLFHFFHSQDCVPVVVVFFACRMFCSFQKSSFYFYTYFLETIWQSRQENHIYPQIQTPDEDSDSYNGHMTCSSSCSV